MPGMHAGMTRRRRQRPGNRVASLILRRRRGRLAPADADARLAEAMEETRARRAGPQAACPPRPVPGSGTDPYAGAVPPEEAIAGLGDAGPQPASARSELAMTSAQPAMGRPYVPGGKPARPEIYDAMSPRRPRGGIPPLPPVPPAGDLRPVLYTGPGWTAGMTPRLRELAEELDSIVDRGYGRNVAETAAAFRHARQGIARAARELCAALGEPEAAPALLRLVHAMVIADRRQTGPQRAAGGAS